ncbi:valine--tRNA ligase, partial [Candidatus Saccharibacteria bacterium 32-50-10]
AEYGSDALRLGLIASRSPGQNQAFSTDRIISGRNFCNKLWNIARFVENLLGDHYELATPVPKTLADHWIISELKTANDNIERSIDSYRFAEAGENVYHAIWDSVADWYIEASKQEPNHDLLAWVLNTSLKLAHPFAPFVTETIWQTLPWNNTILMTEGWPTMINYSEIAAGEFARVQELVTEARFVANSLPGNQRYNLVYFKDSLIEDNQTLIKRLAKLGDIELVDQPRGVRLAVTGRDAWLDVSAATLAEHQTNLEQRLASTHSDVRALEARLGNENYVAKAPAKLVEETKNQLQDKQELIKRLQQELEVLQ